MQLLNGDGGYRRMEFDGLIGVFEAETPGPSTINNGEEGTSLSYYSFCHILHHGDV